MSYCQGCATRDQHVDALEAERDALRAIVNEDNAVCACGCPPDAHESLGEDGESCEDESHQCIRVCYSVRSMFDSLRAQLAAAQQAIGLLTTLAPQMEMRADDLLGMAQEIVATVAASRRIPEDAELDMLWQRIHARLAMPAMYTRERELLTMSAKAITALRRRVAEYEQEHAAELERQRSLVRGFTPEALAEFAEMERAAIAKEPQDA